jgi:hypothetical protein
VPEPVVDGPRIVSGNGITRIIFPIAPVISKDNRPRHSFGVVYANDIALEGMNTTPRLNFRTGAILVREKLSQPGSKTPELLAAMIKREPGFNPAANDWEFLVLNGPATKIRNRSKKGACFECHKSQHDFVYGNYEQK